MLGDCVLVLGSIYFSTERARARAWAESAQCQLQRTLSKVYEGGKNTAVGICLPLDYRREGALSKGTETAQRVLQRAHKEDLVATAYTDGCSEERKDPCWNHVGIDDCFMMFLLNSSTNTSAELV